jgi:hypothetical protein
VVDRDENPQIIKKIGFTECTLGGLFGSQNKTLILDVMDNNKANGKLILRCDLEF